MPADNLSATINQEEQLDISIERVKKINSPLLVLGLGGTGTDILRTIKRTFAERYVLPQDQNGNFIPVPEKTAYLSIDTDLKSQKGLDANEFINISLPGLKAILDPVQRDFNLTPFERKWVNRNLDSAAQGIGAGTYRQAARFMLFRNYTMVLTAITGMLQKIASVNAGTTELNGRTEIVIATGVCGGTGSGTFLDIAQMVRHIIQSDSKLRNIQYHITGYVIMPDVSIANVQGKQALIGILERNGFAALKELDFWMRVGEHKTPYVAQFDNGVQMQWVLPPFDSCVLMSGTTVDGTVYNDAYEVVQKTIAENLLHYLADEVPSQNAKGQMEYTYIQYEDNLTATVNGMSKKLPVHYGYRAIGAYTKRIPKKKLLFYEGERLFSQFIPMRDENRRLVPGDSLFKDGKTGSRATDITGNIRTLYTNFSQRLLLPEYCRTAADDRNKLDAMRSMRPLPHERADADPQPWRVTVVRPTAVTSAGDYLKGAWIRFVDFATDVITDPRLGPFSLQKYLEDGQGLMQALETEKTEWSSLVSGFAKSELNMYQDCRGPKWQAFLRPPLLGAKRVNNAYLKALNEYYNAVRRSTFMVEYAAAMDKLVLRVREFASDSLAPLCQDILTLEQTFTRQDESSNRLESDLLDLKTLKGRIDEEMEQNNENGKIVRGFLGELCEAAFTVQPNADQHGSGVTFIYRQKGMAKLLSTIRESLNKCFSAVNGQSLDSIMLQVAGRDPVEQQRYMDDLAQAVLNSAKPMFTQDPAFTAEEKAAYSYLSVPDDSPEHINRYRETLVTRNVEPKRSSIHDHIYCVASWDGLPLYRYSQIAALEAAYDAELTNSKASMGLHLVWDGEMNSDYTSNWTKLPSPRPYYFFSARGPAHASAAYVDVHQKVERAVACGLVDVDTTGSRPAINLHFYYANPQHSVIKSSAMIREEVDALVAAKDPASGNRIQPAQARDEILRYLHDAGVETIRGDRSPECLAPSMGLEDQPCNPWDATIAGNPTLLATARRNHEALSREMTVAIISIQPKLVSQLEQQLEGFEYARGLIKSIDTSADVWGPRVNYAGKVALLIIHRVIRPSLNGFEYTDAAGEPVAVVQPQLLAADIQSETLLTQCAAHLGDLLAENQIRFELEQLLTEREANLTERERSGSLKREDVEELTKNIESLKTLCREEHSQHKALLRSRSTDVQRIQNILRMLDAIVARAELEEGKLKNLLRFSP
ncbi:MAG: tubulin-like doman-containing protein [Eubacteriales bacterium]|nr:tubulin-like doman-containing protein [Eubacteriales bacterium]